MNRADFNQTGGFPLETDTLDFAQEAYSIFNALAAVAGQLTILAGCEQTGNTVADGVVAINGEVLPFRGGALGNNVIIREDVDERIFEDGESKITYRTRTARFGTGNTSCPWADFVHISPVRELMKSRVPVGMISMWSGAIDGIPAGWVLCDGTNGTPDLRGRFVVGYHSGDNDYNTVGKAGGAKTVTLTVAQMPAHNHTGNTNTTGAHTHSHGRYFWQGGDSFRRGSDANSNGSGTTSSSGNHSHTLNINNTGGGQAHENRPPFYTLAYIMYKGS